MAVLINWLLIDFMGEELMSQYISHVAAQGDFSQPWLHDRRLDGHVDHISALSFPFSSNVGYISKIAHALGE